MDLSGFSDNQYDITLLLGPLYHLYTIEDKHQALKEAIRVTKPGGVILLHMLYLICVFLMKDSIVIMLILKNI